MIAMISRLEEKAVEIREYQRIEKEAVFEIGRILSEVKALKIPVGEWTDWLGSVGLNQRTAQRYMQVYDRFHALPVAEGMPIGKLTELLSLPVDVDASQFIEEVKNESVRTIREKVREAKGIQPKEKTKQTGKVAETIKALRNLNEVHADMLEQGMLSVECAVIVGEFSKDIQRKIIEFYPIQHSFEFALAGDLLKEGYDNEVIKVFLPKFNEVITKKMIFMYDFEIVGMYTEFEELGEDRAALLDWIDRIYKRIKELELKREQEKSDFDDFFEQFGGGSSSFKGAKVGQVHSSSITRLLGLTETATGDEIKREFRRIIKVLHPDTGGSPYLFQVVKEAYDEYKKCS